ncbi:MAG TPA: hypothetical protein VF288_02335 [Mycobacteriales bacterium]
MTSDASNSLHELEICWQLPPVKPPHERRRPHPLARFVARLGALVHHR